MKKIIIIICLIILFYNFYKYCSNEFFYKKHALVYYTCFFGGNNNIANKINDPPSNVYDCYYFTNNQLTYNSLIHTNWIPIFIDTPIKESLTQNSMDAKELKACPHHFKELQKYEYTCYLDSKLYVKSNEVEDMINNIFKNEQYLYIVSKHPFIKNSVWDEYNACLEQERYAVEKHKYYNYIMKQLNSGLSDVSDVHYQTGFIIRKSCEKTNEINDMWYSHIKECGIECQISFFFIQQLYKPYIYTIDTYGYT